MLELIVIACRCKTWCLLVVTSDHVSGNESEGVFVLRHLKCTFWSNIRRRQGSSIEGYRICNSCPVVSSTRYGLFIRRTYSPLSVFRFYMPTSPQYSWGRFVRLGSLAGKWDTASLLHVIDRHALDTFLPSANLERFGEIGKGLNSSSGWVTMTKKVDSHK